MVWGAISQPGLILIRRIKDTLNSSKYCERMGNDIISILNKHLGYYLFLQINAGCLLRKITVGMFVWTRVKIHIFLN